MYKEIKIVASLIILFILLSCNNFSNMLLNYTHPQLGWIEFRSNVLPPGEWAYAQIRESEIWEKGNNRVELEKVIRDTLGIAIDGIQVSEDKYLLSDTFTAPINVLDDSGNVLGSYGEFMNLYFETSTVIGTHTATIELTSSSGKKYSYSWNFTISTDESKLSD